MKVSLAPFLTHLVFCFLTWCLKASAAASPSTGRTIMHLNPVETAKLQCEIREKDSSLKWIKDPEGNRTNMEELCEETKEKESKMKCSLAWSSVKGQDLQLYTLSMSRVREGDYGLYQCQDKNGQRKRSIELRGLIKVSRKPGNGSIERSAIVVDGQPLSLYCNYTGTQNYRNDFTITWFKDNVDITSDLEGRQGLFTGFEKIEEGVYQGNVTHNHRGNYTCAIGLNPSNENNHTNISFPLQYTFSVRVRDANRWMLPTFILIGEVSLLTIFTLLWWRKVEGVEGGIDGDYADSDDEDGEEDAETKDK